MIKRLAIIALVSTGLCANEAAPTKSESPATKTQLVNTIKRSIANPVKNVSTVAAFNDEIKKDNVTVAKFWMPGCPPCTASDGMYTELAKSYTDVTFLKINIKAGQGKQLVKKYKFRGVPTFMIFKKSNVLFKKSGYTLNTTKNELVYAITSAQK